MPKSLLTSLGGVLAALALAGPVAAEAGRPGHTASTYAVLVGISEHADDDIRPRRRAEADVKALHDLVVSKDHFAAQPRDVKLLLGSGTGTGKATRANILASLKWLAEEAGPNDLALIAFFGAGAPRDSSGTGLCYFAVDSTFKGRGRDAVAAAEVGEALKGIKSRKVCTFLDVHFKGFRGATGVAEPTLGQPPLAEFMGDDGSAEHLPLPGRTMFLATNGLSPSLELEKHGLFAEALLAGLSGAADKEAHDGDEPDGLVTVDELQRYLNKEIARLSRLHGTTAREKEAPHFIWGGPQGHYVLCANPGAAPAARKRLAKFERLVKDGVVPARYGEEGRTLLEQMPRLKSRQALRRAYKDLADGSITLARFEERRDQALADAELPRPEADTFARKVIEATRIVRDDYVRVVNQGEMVGWAIRGLYRDIEERIPEKIEVKLKRARGMREADLTWLLADARQELGRREDLDKENDVRITLRRMLQNLDSLTIYIDPETARKWRADINDNFTGIGAQVRKDAATEYLQVVTPIKGSPAYKAGVYAGDLITTITREVDSEGKPLTQREVTSTKDVTLNGAVRLLLGEPGTKVKLTIQRHGREKPLEVEISRGRVAYESVLGFQRKESDDWDHLIDPKSKIGYIRLSGFTSNSVRDLEKAVRGLADQGMKALVLDLRFNLGGYLNPAIGVSDLFIDDGLILTVKGRGGVESKFNGKHEGSQLDFPMVCLVNESTAAGSEIVAAALQDHRRALIFGERTSGAASIQNIKDLDGELKGHLKLTTSSFWRPSGKNLNKSSTGGKDEDEWGVVPDKVIKLSPREREDLLEHQRRREVIERPDRRSKANKTDFKDRQLDAALEYLRGQIKTR